MLWSTIQRNLILISILVVLSVHAASFLYIKNLSESNSETAAYPLLKGDSETYAALADSLLESGSFVGSQFESERHWPPAYSAFLAVTKWVSGGWYFAVVLQVLAALGAVFLIHKMSLRFLPTAWAVVPALLYGLDPNVILANTTVLSDGLFGSLMISIVYIAFFVEMKREWVRWSVVGFLLAIATLMRPIAQFLVVFAPIFLAAHLYWRGSTDVRGYLFSFASYVVLAALVLTPWLTWVHSRHGVYEVSHVGASNLLHYNVQDFLAWKAMNKERFVPAILSTRYHDDPAYTAVRAEIGKELEDMTPPEALSVNYEGSLAVMYVLNDPLRYAYFHLVNTAPFFLGSSFAAYEQVATQVRDNSGYFAPTMLALVESVKAVRTGNMETLVTSGPIALEVLGWLGVCVLAFVAVLKKRRDFLVLICGALILYFAILTGPVSIARYRIPAEPYMLILAVLGARILYERIIKSS